MDDPRASIITPSPLPVQISRKTSLLSPLRTVQQGGYTKGTWICRRVPCIVFIWSRHDACVRSRQRKKAT